MQYAFEQDLECQLYLYQYWLSLPIFFSDCTFQPNDIVSCQIVIFQSLDTGLCGLLLSSIGCALETLTQVD